ncbi:hypothetical protein [Pseudoalteromonas luteoviolacea]|uniref:Uncharacterized protein n=1 Tax=Pseudoalteromonas luteoviolacea (strain 2ta16) TaxID=1353533 RepID=V4HS53_PSEL2|nr:hypothetical protein [Pseudoalteromonas luteoviolacea]ESP93660.1 hypothetical protein PL2TA16_03046 [Pseudoalteromonas luteoviolacea 2ta16]KZN42450.1 hypothetical protein N483_13090 [Pseudoalteromonas luteoviolacea NCIMB 1944]
MKDENNQICLTGSEAIEILKEVNTIMLSLHKIGSKYEEYDDIEYCLTTTKFIDEWKVTQRLATIRRMIKEKFDLSLGEDDMDDVERAMENIKIWSDERKN